MYSRIKHWLTITALMAVALGLALALRLTLVILRYGSEDRARPADVIIVLGGGRIGTERRALHGAALYHQGIAPTVLCTGSITVEDDPAEANICAQTLQAQGVPRSAITLETRSRSTEENAIQSVRIMQARGWKNAVLVSDDFHLWRAHWLFQTQGAQVWTSPAQLTSGSLGPGGEALAILREIAATGWYIGKSVLGLPYTNFTE